MDSDRTFFVTTITAGRLPIFRRDTTAKLLIDTLAHYREQQKFLLHEFVIMLDLHALLTPAPEISLERAMQFIKGGFSFRLGSKGPVWQASFTNHRIRDQEDFVHHRQLHSDESRACAIVIASGGVPILFRLRRLQWMWFHRGQKAPFVCRCVNAPLKGRSSTRLTSHLRKRERFDVP